MRTALISAATAAAIALSPMASAPARAADADDILGALLGLAVLGVIVNEVNDRNDDRVTTTRRTSTVNYGKHHRGNKYGHNNRRSRVLPSQCLRVFEGRRNDRLVFPERCLNRQGISDAALPNRCERRINARRGPITVYGARCMADAGWRLPRIARAGRRDD